MTLSPAEDWTRASKAAVGLALSAWTRDEKRLADPTSARLLELALEAVVLGRGLQLNAFLVLPGSVHLVVGWDSEGEKLPWPLAFGQLRALYARWDNRRLGRSGSVWSAKTRIRPLLSSQLGPALTSLRSARRAQSAGQPPAWATLSHLPWP